MSRILRLVLLLFACHAGLVVTVAADYIDAVKKGNEALKAGDAKTALEHYHVAEADIPESAELDYNMAGAHYTQGAYESAIEKYTRSLNSPDINVEQMAHYNLGNTHYRMGDYAKAIESYQKALEIKPSDVDAKFNLELARRMLKEQSQRQSSDEQQQPKQQPQEGEKKQEEQEKPQDRQEPQQDQPPQEQQAQEQQPQPQPVEPGDKMSKEDAERILNALRDDEKDTQEKIKRSLPGQRYTGKDW